MNIYDQIYNEKLGELIKDIAFTYTVRNFNGQVLNALKYHSETTLDCSLEEYEKVYLIAVYNGKWFMPEMFVALQAVKSITQHNSDYTNIIDWIAGRKSLNEMSETWNTIAAPYMEQARKFAQDKAKRDKRELEAKSKLVQLNGKPAHAK